MFTKIRNVGVQLSAQLCRTLDTKVNRIMRHDCQIVWVNRLVTFPWISIPAPNDDSIHGRNEQLTSNCYFFVR